VNFSLAPLSFGALIALVVVLLCIVFIAIGHLSLLLGLLIGLTALSRLC
jgi:hypothetical protein